MKHNLYIYLKQRQTLFGLGLIVLDVVFFNATNPNRVPSAFLIVGFVLAALSVYVLWRFLLAVASMYGLPLRDRGRRPAMFLGVASAVTLALQSLGELTLRDVVVLMLLSLIAYIYTSYGRATRRSGS